MPDTMTNAPDSTMTIASMSRNSRSIPSSVCGIGGAIAAFGSSLSSDRQLRLTLSGTSGIFIGDDLSTKAPASSGFPPGAFPALPPAPMPETQRMLRV